MATGAKTLSTLALTLFGLAGSVVVITVPRLFIRPERPGFAVFLLAGLAVIVLTADLFVYIYRLRQDGPAASGIMLLSVVIGALYSLPPARLSYRTFLAPLSLAAAYVGIPY